METNKVRELWQFVAQQDTLDSGDPGDTFRSFDAQSNSLWQDSLFSIDSEDQVASASQNKTAIQEAMLEIRYERLQKTPSDNYETKEKIAEGGMGIIYRGRQHSLQRDIAVKKMKIGQGDPTKCGKFVSESLVTAYLDHPNIVPAHDLGQNKNGEIFFAMKLVDGVSWKHLLYPETEEHRKQAAHYDLEKHLQILLSVCNALAFAHSRNIVHNDIKPSNIMVGNFGEVLVMDWGISVDIGEEYNTRTWHKSQISTPMGTPCYMPCELAEGRGEDIGPWTDIYLLGATLYEILMRQPPHSGSPIEAIYSSVTGQLPNFSSDIPQTLQDICYKALAHAPENRYQNISEFQEAILLYLKHRESLSLTQKAQEMLQETNSYIAQNTSTMLSWNGFALFLEAPSKSIFPYWWYSSAYAGKIFLVTLLLISLLFASDIAMFASVLVLCIVLTNIMYIVGYGYHHLFAKDTPNPRIRLAKQHRNYVYLQLMQTIALLQRAIELWPKNTVAQQQKQLCYIRLSQVAIDNKDLGIAEMCLPQFPKVDSPEILQVRERLQEVKIETKSDVFVVCLSKFFMMIVTGIILYHTYNTIHHRITSHILTPIEINESIALKTLQDFLQQQHEFQNSRLIDQDHNGVGEFAFLQEIAGKKSLRGSHQKTSSASDIEFIGNFLYKSGYLFGCYLPGETHAMSETDYYTCKDPQVIQKQQQQFVIYAWPKELGITGNKAFVVDATGMILTCDQHSYASLHVPPAYAAFAKGTDARNLQQQLLPNQIGQDNNFWK